MIEKNESVLLIIDFQQTFLDKIRVEESDQLVRKACWLIEVAHCLDIPIIYCVEDGRYPTLVEPLRRHVGSSAVIRKTFFSVAREKSFLSALSATSRRSLVLIGFETDVCIAQSALGLATQGYTVAVVEDVMHAPGDGQRQGLERMSRAGISVLSLRALYYEWMADVATERTFRQERDDLYSEQIVIF